MLLKLENHLSAKFSFLKKKKLLLAISGGLDSMVMLDLFRKLNYDIAIAHCNFQLRGVESFQDQNFVKNYASENDIPFFVTQFDTANYASNYKKSIQVAARELRYDWFYELLETQKIDFVLTAHHADDNLETFLINFTRGTGLDGLTGIPEQNEQLIRPLLFFSRLEIENHAQEYNIKWREDASNASDKYLRNKIRHDIVPVLKDLNSHLLTSFQKTQHYLQEAQSMIEDASEMVYQQIAEEKKEAVYFDLKKLKQLTNYKSYLYYWLHDYGFTAWNDIYNLVDSQSGKQVLTSDFKIIKDRGFLILTKYNLETASIYTIQKNQQEVKIPLNISILPVEIVSKTNSNTIFVDENKLVFPLIIRKWEEGDCFYPFGMNGKKKVSKYFKDQKFSLIDKENTWLLCSNTTIVWIINHRLDNRFQITNNTTSILKIALEE